MNYMFVCDGGIQSKNSPLFSLSAYLLSDNAKMTGVKVNTYLTKDNKIVCADSETLTSKGINKKYINTHTYDNIKKINIGNKVKKHNLILIDELISIFKDSNKCIILNLLDEHEKNYILVNKIKSVSNFHKNLYIMSSSIDIINILLNSKINNKIGINIIEKPDWKYILDFYCVSYPNIDIAMIYEKYNEGKEIMISNIKSYEEFLNLEKLLKSILSDIFIITKIPYQLKSHLF